MILEDDSPIRFTIPRKTEIKEKPAPESRSVEPEPQQKASPKQPGEAENHRDEPKKKSKAKRGKANDKVTQEPVVQSGPEETQDAVNNDVGGGEQICVPPDSSQDADISGMFRK